MTRAFIPGESLTAFERWELGAFAAERAAGAPRDADDAGLSPAAAAAQAADDAARENGYAAGYAAGRAAGLAAGAAEAQAQAARLRQIADEAAASARAFDAALAEDVLDLALEVARQVLRTDAQARRDALPEVVREALRALPQGITAPTLALNPGDVALVRAQIGDELAACGCRVVEDFRMEPGGCRVGSPACEVDATLATRWKRVLAALGRDHAWTDSAAA